MRAAESDRRIAELACGQHGVVARGQLLDAGLDRSGIGRRVSSGALVVAGRGVYRVRGVPPTWLGDTLVAVLACGEGAVASHATAAALHRLDGWRQGRVEVTVPRGVRRRPQGAVVHARRVRLASERTTRVDAIPVTSLEQTLIDLASWRGLHRAESALDGAERDRLTRPESVTIAAEEFRGRGRTRVGAFSELVAARVGAAQPTTYLERLVTRAVSGHGLARPACQVPITLTDGRRVVVDFAYVDRGIVIEADGRRGHAGDRDRQADAERDNALQLAGWTVLRFTYRDLRERPWWFASILHRALTA